MYSSRHSKISPFSAWVGNLRSETLRRLYARYLLSRAHSARPSARATIGYLVYNYGVRFFGGAVQEITQLRRGCVKKTGLYGGNDFFLFLIDIDKSAYELLQE